MSHDLAGEIVAAAKAELWRRGVLRWKLHSEQQAIYDQMRQAELDGERRFVMEIARRFGKTWLLAVWACEVCLRTPGVRVVFGAPSLKHLQEFILPTFEAVTRDAPADVRPRFHTQSGHWRFPNGSWTHLFGADDKLKASRGRGAESACNIFDEAGFSPVLEYVLDDVFKATTMHTGGMTLLGSTPSDLADHPFTRIAERAERDGYFARRTIHENPLLSQERIAEFIAEGAREQGLSVEEYQLTDTFRREYMAERVVDPRMVVLGDDWEKKREKLRVAVPRPAFYDAMTVLDPGGNDPHAISFGYWHFELAKYVQEDELLLRKGENTEDIAAQVKEKERALWGVDLWDGTLRVAAEDETGAIAQTVPEWMQDVLRGDARPQPYARWMDINVGLARDLYQLHKMAFLNTAKDELGVQVNNLRVAIRREEYLLHPRCVHTDRHFVQTTWKDAKRRVFAHKGGEHGDLLATAIYATRNVDRQRNPYPRGWVAPARPLPNRPPSGLPALPPLRTRRVGR